MESRYRYKLYLLCLALFFTGCTPERIIIRPEYLEKNQIKSIKVSGFKSYPPYLQDKTKSQRTHLGISIENFIKKNCIDVKKVSAKENCIDVVDKKPDAILTGSVHIGNIKTDSFPKKYKSDGRIKIMYCFKKKIAIKTNFELKYDKKLYVKDSFVVPYEKEWDSKESLSEAKSEAMTDEEFYYKAIEKVAKKIAHYLSPHIKEKYFNFIEFK